MKYFRDSQGEVFGYDETDKTQQGLITAATAKGWEDISDSWPPPPVEPALPSIVSSAALLAKALIDKGIVTQEDLDALATSNGVAFGDINTIEDEA